MSKRKASDASISSSSGVPTKKSRGNVIARVNSLEAKELRKQYVPHAQLQIKVLDGPSAHNEYLIKLKDAKGLLGADFRACFDLIESSSKLHYARSSWGWHVKRKQTEMKEETMRYLLLKRAGPKQNPSKKPEPEGFLSFMFTHDSVPSVPVLYVYEIHLLAALRGSGVGTTLMRLIEGVAQRVGVKKVMLTCFVSNAKAMEFYHKLGFAADPCSPGAKVTRTKRVEADYVIMSKVVQPIVEVPALAMPTTSEKSNVPPVDSAEWREAEMVARSKATNRYGGHRALVKTTKPSLKQS